MKSNVGSGDRVFRITLGLVLLVSVWVFGGGFWWLGLIGLIALATGIAAWCPAYSLFGIRSNGRRRAPT